MWEIIDTIIWEFLLLLGWVQDEVYIKGNIYVSSNYLLEKLTLDCLVCSIDSNLSCHYWDFILKKSHGNELATDPDGVCILNELEETTNILKDPEHISLMTTPQDDSTVNGKKTCWIYAIGERSEPPSDKLGGEIFISSHGLYVCHYIYMESYGQTTNTMPTHIVCVHSH